MELTDLRFELNNNTEHWTLNETGHRWTIAPNGNLESTMLHYKEEKRNQNI